MPINEFSQICTKEKIKCVVVIFPLLKFNSTYYQWGAQENKLIKELDYLRIPYLSLRNSYQRYILLNR